MEHEAQLYDGVETVSGFTYLVDRCEAAVTCELSVVSYCMERDFL